MFLLNEQGRFTIVCVPIECVLRRNHKRKCHKWCTLVALGGDSGCNRMATRGRLSAVLLYVHCGCIRLSVFILNVYLKAQHCHSVSIECVLWRLTTVEVDPGDTKG